MTVRRWSPPLIWAGVILLLTSIPNPPVPRELAAGDKIAHFSLYAGFGFLLARAILHGTARWPLALLAVPVAVAAAGLDEWHQQFIPGRSMDAADWRADALGATLGVLTALVVHRVQRSSTPINEH